MTRDPIKYVSIDFTYVDEYGETRLCKTVEEDYLGESQLGVLNAIYLDFLGACGFYTAGKRVELVDDTY